MIELTLQTQGVVWIQPDTNSLCDYRKRVCAFHKTSKFVGIKANTNL